LRSCLLSFVKLNPRHCTSCAYGADGNDPYYF